MSLLGMDVDEIERIGRDLMTNQHSQLQSVLQAISGHVGTLPGIWHGIDSSNFIQEWESTHKPALNNLMTQIHELGNRAIQQAAQQRQVSGA